MKKQRTPKNILLERYESTIKNGVKFEGNLEEINYFKTFSKADAKNQMFKMHGCNVCMLNYKDDSVLIIFAIPIRSAVEGDENKHVSERMMDVVKNIEDVFISVESMTASEVKEDKMIYLTIIKEAGE
jgi:ABC-type uncharacterized transport system substrate-binding protein